MARVKMHGILSHVVDDKVHALRRPFPAMPLRTSHGVDDLSSRSLSLAGNAR